MIDHALAGKLRLVGISGSSVAPSKTRVAVQTALAFASEAHCDVYIDLISLSECRLEFCDGRDPSLYDRRTREVLERVVSADALIVGSPIYRGSYPGALKNLFDLIPSDALEGKVVGLIATGGSEHHFLAIEQELKPLIGFFRAYVIPGGVYAHDGHFAGEEIVEEAIVARLGRLALSVVEATRRLAPPAAGAVNGHRVPAVLAQHAAV